MSSSLLDRFEYPSRYVASKMQHCGFQSLDENTILFKKDNILVTISEDKYKLMFTGEGEINIYDLEMIINCQKLLEDECKYSNIKSAILNTPKLESIYLSPYDDAGNFIYVGGSEARPMFRLYKNGHIQRLDFSQRYDMIEMEYVFNLSQYIILSFDTRRVETNHLP